MASTEERIHEMLAAVRGKPCWGAKLGSFLTLELGKPDTQEPAHGQWHLWIYSATWRVDVNGECIAALEDDEPRLTHAVAQINGRTLERVDLGSLGDAQFLFTEGLRIHAFANSALGPEPNWMLYRPNVTVLSVGPGLHYTVEPSHGREREPHR